MIDIPIDTQLASLLTSAAFIIIGLFAAIFMDNIIKKIIGIAFIEEGANLFIVTLGYKHGGIIPIILPTEWFHYWFGIYCRKTCPYIASIKRMRTYICHVI
jgi:energy-converting hydrogenase B subunit E